MISLTYHFFVSQVGKYLLVISLYDSLGAEKYSEFLCRHFCKQMIIKNQLCILCILGRFIVDFKSRLRTSEDILAKPELLQS